MIQPNCSKLYSKQKDSPGTSKGSMLLFGAALNSRGIAEDCVCFQDYRFARPRAKGILLLQLSLIPQYQSSKNVFVGLPLLGQTASALHNCIGNEEYPLDKDRGKKLQKIRPFSMLF